MGTENRQEQEEAEKRKRTIGNVGILIDANATLKEKFGAMVDLARSSGSKKSKTDTESMLDPKETASRLPSNERRTTQPNLMELVQLEREIEAKENELAKKGPLSKLIDAKALEKTREQIDQYKNIHKLGTDAFQKELQGYVSSLEYDFGPQKRASLLEKKESLLGESVSPKSLSKELGELGVFVAVAQKLEDNPSYERLCNINTVNNNELQDKLMGKETSSPEAFLNDLGIKTDGTPPPIRLIKKQIESCIKLEEKAEMLRQLLQLPEFTEGQKNLLIKCYNAINEELNKKPNEGLAQSWKEKNKELLGACKAIVVTMPEKLQELQTALEQLSSRSSSSSERDPSDSDMSIRDSSSTISESAVDPTHSLRSEGGVSDNEMDGPDDDNDTFYESSESFESESESESEAEAPRSRRPS